MALVKTLSERKADGAARLTAGVDALRIVLRAAAAESGGWFILYGSAVRGALRHDSDVDILLDFPASRTPQACEFAEDACARLGLPHDIRPVALCGTRFLAQVLPTGEVLG